MSARNSCKIKRLVTGDRVPLLSVTFDHVNLTKNRAEDVECDVVKDSTSQNHTVLVAHKNHLYSGKSLPASESLYKTLLLIVDDSGKGTIVPTVPCRLSNATSEVAPKKPKFDSPLMVDLDQSKFGSKKYQRMVNTSNKLKSTKAGSSSALEKSLMGIETTDLDHSNASLEGKALNQDLETEVLPPSSRDADHVSDVYPISGLLNPNELDELEEGAALYLDPPEDPSTDSDFLVYPFYKDIKNKTPMKMKLLLYANSILRFVQFRIITNKEKTIKAISPHSFIVGKKIVEMFSVQGIKNQRIKNDALNDKALCHAMVAILIACDYHIQLDWFAGAIKSPNHVKIKKHVMNLARVVGLRQTKVSSITYYCLRVPMPPLPTVKMPRKKKTR